MPQSKVEMLEGLAGNGFTYNAGSVQTLPAEVAARWVEKGLAKYVEQPTKSEAKTKAKRTRRATRKPTEKR